MTLIYQKAGIYPWADAEIIPALTEIARAVGVPGISISAFQAGGVGHHRRGRAGDFQAGKRETYADSVKIHNAIADYILLHWKRLRVRYLAWDGMQYGGSWGGPERARPQTWEPWFLTASDPWHRNHVHVDFHDGPIPGAVASIAIGTLTSPSDPTAPVGPIISTPTTTTPAFSLEEEMKLVKTSTSTTIWATNGMTRRKIATQPEAASLEKIWGKTQIISKEALDRIPQDQTSFLADKAGKTNAAMGRVDSRVRDLVTAVQDSNDALATVLTEVHDPAKKRTLRERVEQNNAAIGRAEKARLEAEKEQN